MFILHFITFYLFIELTIWSAISIKMANEPVSDAKDYQSESSGRKELLFPKTWMAFQMGRHQTQGNIF